VEILAQYGTESQTFYFPLIDYGATDLESTPVTHATGDTQISKDGGTFANTTNAFAHEGNGIYSLTLTATEMQASRVLEVDTTSTAASTTAFEADRLAPNTTNATTADFYNGKLIMFIDGSLLGQTTDITDFASQNSREYFTVSALTSAPSNGDKFVVF
jgi:hypothetical protein